MGKAKISVIIPVRNERQYIIGCLESIITGTTAHDLLEVFVVDGMSDDGTREVTAEFSLKYPFVNLLDNKAKTAPCAMNIGITRSTGEVVVRMDAHALYPKDYIERLVEVLETSGADNVGGVIITVPSNATAQAHAVAGILSHPFGVGNSHFRIGSSKIREVDTVPFGCYRRAVFDRIGLYDEMLTRNQDDELNGRLMRRGGKILLIPDIRITYFARDSISKMAKMLYQGGYFKPLVNVKIGGAATWRQLVPPAFVASVLLTGIGGLFYGKLFMALAFILISYGTVDILASASIAREKGAALFPFLFAGFIIAHFSYGGGYLRGVLDFMVFRREKHFSGDLPITR